MQQGMKRRIGFAAAATLWLGAGATTVQAATAPCLSEPEAEALMVTLLPDVIDGVGKACAPALAPQATLRGGLPPLLARYRAEAPAAWPLAGKALGKMMGEKMQGVDPELMRPLVGAMMAPMIAKDIKPADCPKIDRIITLLSPLPVRNTAGVVVLLFQLGSSGKPDKSPFQICPAAPAR